MKINNKRRDILKAKKVKGFDPFIKNVKGYPLNTPFKIDNVIENEWNAMNRSERLSLGKTVKSNVQKGVISGLECIPVGQGKPQEYKRVADVVIDESFKCDYVESNKFTNMKDLLNSPIVNSNTIIAIGFFEKNENEASSVYRCKLMNAQGEVLAECERDLKDEFFEQYRNDGIVKYGEAYAEFRALFCFWYLVDRCFENQNLFNEENEILFVAPNEQMIKRLAGISFDSQGNSYFYNEMINDLFDAFTKDGYRELKNHYKSTPQLNGDIKKIFA